jgi:hypothetical protein
MQKRMFEKIKRDIELEFKVRLNNIERVKENVELISGLNDSELRILQKNPYFHESRRKTLPLINFLECSELTSDVAFNNLRSLYKKIITKDPYVHYGDEESHPLQPVALSLSNLATKMANRTLTENEYNLIVNGEHETLVRGREIIETQNYVTK